MAYPFNVRIYGLLFDERKENILLSKENINQTTIFKFPGGGLQFGEGIIDCVKREWQEELKLEIEIISHLYTTDFFQVSAFNNHEQIISIYYLVKVLIDENTLLKHITHINSVKEQERGEIFFFTSLKHTSTSFLSFPIDRIVFDKLKAERMF